MEGGFVVLRNKKNSLVQCSINDIKNKINRKIMLELLLKINFGKKPEII